MGNYVKKTFNERVQLIEESKVLGFLETARKHNLHYQTIKNWVDTQPVNIFILKSKPCNKTGYFDGDVSTLHALGYRHSFKIFKISNVHLAK